MHMFRSYEYQDIVCQKLQRLVQAAVSYRIKSSRHAFSLHDTFVFTHLCIFKCFHLKFMVILSRPCFS